MTTKSRWMVRSVVWILVALVTLALAAYRGETSPRGIAELAFLVSTAMGMLGAIYFLGGVTGDAFPPHTVVDLNSAQGRRGQPLDHGRSGLARPTLGGVIMVAAGLAALISVAVWLLWGRP